MAQQFAFKVQMPFTWGGTHQSRDGGGSRDPKRGTIEDKLISIHVTDADGDHLQQPVGVPNEKEMPHYFPETRLT